MGVRWKTTPRAKAVSYGAQWLMTTLQYLRLRTFSDIFSDSISIVFSSMP